MVIILQRFFFLLNELNPVITGGQSTAAPVAEAVAEGANVVQNTAEASGSAFSTVSMLLIYAVVFGAAWFFIFRPQRKRDKEMKQMQSDIRVGDNVVTTAGFYGKVVDIGEDVFIVEFGSNRGIRIPVRKSDISGVKDPKLTPPPVKADAKE